MQPAAATDFYTLQQRVSVTARNQVRRLWAGMGRDFNGSWERLGPAIFAVIAQAQFEVANASIGYLDNLADQTTPAAPEGLLAPGAFVGVASDGRSLASLSYGAVVKAGEAVNDGATATKALEVGGSWLDLMARLQVADAARMATSVGAAARPAWGGYVRYLAPPSCSRCAVLAGKWFKWNAGFQRHPKCDCQHFPSSSAGYARAEGFIGNPDEAWRAGHIKDLTRAQVSALEHGADISQVINARRGMSTTVTMNGHRIPFTTEGATRRGVFGSSSAATRAGSRATAVARRQGAVTGYVERRSTLQRLTPESIYRIADDRDEAIRLLRRFGYLT